MPKKLYAMRLEDSTIGELEAMAKARQVPVSQVLREIIDRELASSGMAGQGVGEGLTLEQLVAARARLDRLIAEAQARRIAEIQAREEEAQLIAELRAKEAPPDLVMVELKEGVWIQVPRAEALKKKLQFREKSSRGK